MFQILWTLHSKGVLKHISAEWLIYASITQAIIVLDVGLSPVRWLELFAVLMTFVCSDIHVKFRILDVSLIASVKRHMPATWPRATKPRSCGSREELFTGLVKHPRISRDLMSF